MLSSKMAPTNNASKIEAVGDDIVSVSSTGFAIGTVLGYLKISKHIDPMAQPQFAARHVAMHATGFALITGLFVGTSEAIAAIRAYQNVSGTKLNEKENMKFNYGIGGAITGPFIAIFKSYTSLPEMQSIQNIDAVNYKYNETLTNSSTTQSSSQTRSKFTPPVNTIKPKSFIKSTIKHVMLAGVLGFAYGTAAEQFELS